MVVDDATAQDLLKRVMEYYNIHYDVVQKKLDHAQTATHESMKEANDWDMKVIGSYDSAWKEIINMFQTCGMTQEELFEIERILGALPDNIRGHFERLIKMDRMLQTMMMTLKKLNYEEAMKTINQVQSQPNPLTGLGPEEYDLRPQATTEAKQVQAFKIMKV